MQTPPPTRTPTTIAITPPTNHHRTEAHAKNVRLPTTILGVDAKRHSGGSTADRLAPQRAFDRTLEFGSSRAHRQLMEEKSLFLVRVPKKRCIGCGWRCVSTGRRGTGSCCRVCRCGRRCGHRRRCQASRENIHESAECGCGCVQRRELERDMHTQTYRERERKRRPEVSRNVNASACVCVCVCVCEEACVCAYLRDWVSGASGRMCVLSVCACM
jgi:hypothetical protein